MSIPKIIHYVWVGGNLKSKDIQRCMKTWKKHLKDYEIIEWNERNFDINQNQYCKEAYEAKKWAFVTDYVRLKVLYDYGGIYMDSDVEVCKSLDDFRQYNWFSGFESINKIPTGTMGSCWNGEVIKLLLDDYNDRHFIKDDGSYDITTNVETITKILSKEYDVLLNNTRQVFGDRNILFPFDYLCAKDLMDGKIKVSINTYTIHHFAGSWLTPWLVRRHKLKIFLVHIFGSEFVNVMKKLFLNR